MLSALRNFQGGKAFLQPGETVARNLEVSMI